MWSDSPHSAMPVLAGLHSKLDPEKDFSTEDTGVTEEGRKKKRKQAATGKQHGRHVRHA
jgi:hypothetical protein